MTSSITLAGVTYELSPLTLGQVEKLAIAVTLPDSGDPQERIRRSYVRSIETVAIAIGKTPDELRAMTISRDELNTAFDSVLVHSGLVPAGSAETGEAPAAASTGNISTAG